MKRGECGQDNEGHRGNNIKMSGNGITAEQAIAAVRETKGFVTTIAKRLGCSRKHVYTLADKFPTVKAAIEEEREGVKDFAEGKLLEQINAGNITAIIFYLKTQAKGRGYIERLESANLNIDITALTDEQLRRIADGESPVNILTAQSSG